MNRPVRLVASPAKALFTTAEFLRMGEIGAFDDMRVELIHGEIERMPPPLSDHASVQAMVVAQLWPIARDNGLQVMSEVGIDVGDDTVLACDAAMLAAVPEANRLLLPADLLLVVEVAVSSLSRDLGSKCDAYAAAGIPTYWVIDAGAQVVHVREVPRDGRYTRSTLVRFGESLAVPGGGAITLD